MAEPQEKVGIDQNENRSIIEAGLRKSKDETFHLTLAEEKFLKRCRQIGSSLLYVIVYDGKPIMLFVGGKVEVLDKFQA